MVYHSLSSNDSLEFDTFASWAKVCLADFLQLVLDCNAYLLVPQLTWLMLRHSQQPFVTQQRVLASCQGLVFVEPLKKFTEENTSNWDTVVWILNANSKWWQNEAQHNTTSMNYSTANHSTAHHNSILYKTRQEFMKKKQRNSKFNQ